MRSLLINKKVYDLPPEVPWMRRVAYSCNYGNGQIIIAGDDSRPRIVPAELSSTIDCLDAHHVDWGLDVTCQMVYSLSC